jgi:MerR family transcriptional regulator, light-induced transcriptional regulator
MRQPAQIEFRLELDTQPIYNIKAVVEATGLPAATLRAWERRYRALAPSRTESGYRLYSDSDVATLHWLKARIGEGLSISQALTLLNRSHMSVEPLPAVDRQAGSPHGMIGDRDALLSALLGFDENHANHVIEEAFAVYGLEPVAEYIITPVMIHLGDLWHHGRASTTAEHFASNYLRRKLDAIINAAPKPDRGRLIVLGCAPEDWHELGLQLLHLMLRRRGLNSIYLGQNVPVAQFVEEMARLRPVIVIIAATIVETVPGLAALGEAVATMAPPRPIFTYGGRIFNVRPELRDAIPGIFLGESARAAADYVNALVSAAAISGLGASTQRPPRLELGE